MHRKRLLIISLLIGTWALAACAAPPPTEPDEQRARETLVQFFDLLSAGGYDDAARLYGGTYETLISWNPEIAAADFPALWRNGCELNGLQCLPVRSAEFVERVDDTFLYEVEFSNPDGTLFVRGPCCGADETQMPSESKFDFRVRHTSDGAFEVLDMPVYVP